MLDKTTPQEDQHLLINRIAAFCICAFQIESLTARLSDLPHRQRFPKEEFSFQNDEPTRSKLDG